MYNASSFYVNEEKQILIKKKDILKILQAYKIQIYEGKVAHVHFKDIYQILVKKVFKDEFDDFEVSKYLKNKMKSQWNEKHKKVGSHEKSDFKAHEAYASAIITSYATLFRFRKEQKKLEANKQASDSKKKGGPQYEMGFIAGDEVTEKTQGVQQPATQPNTR